eukprot:CAMPEP_0204357830 /NCGR_PEP_ID=MMETSP0469-20131031/36058_1 /ASSEMBLY_ACC=CAM_ASM_000384 /TAXON_ID=2969 /ORGANISM="Oxyrrhis marina" /LENGTH=37 /DNA_ID= /DNA_START= /DNA_END= /DNA_ORIENTATION=
MASSLSCLGGQKETLGSSLDKDASMPASGEPPEKRHL